MSNKTENDDCDIVMFHFGPSAVAPSLSQFCLKLETYFRMANLKYALETTMKVSSKGKLPYITYKGKVVEDSSFIIDHLNKELNVDLDSHLSQAEKGIGLAFKRLCEENLYWVQMYQRFIVDNASFLKKNMPMKGMMKKMFPLYVYMKAKPGVKANTCGQGIGRHTKEEIYEIGEKDFTAISEFLGKKPFMMGDLPSLVDASIFGVVAQTVYCSQGTEQETFVKEKLPNLVAYCDRMKEKFWPDWDECCWVEAKDTPKPEEAAASAEQKPAEEQAEAQNAEGGDAPAPAPAPADEQQKTAEGAE